MRRWALAAALGAITACTPLPDAYPVPEQRVQKDGPEPEPLAGFVSMADPRSPDYVVEGFLPPGAGQTWLWATTKPTVRVRVSDTKGLRLRMNFAFPDDSHKALLPITVKYFVNEKLLDTVVYKQTGVLEYRKPVPAEWLKVNEDNRIRCEVSPVYVAQADGQRLAYILSEIGLEHDQ